MEQIAEQAGVGVATVYRGFGSKVGLVQALFADSLDETVALLEECAQAPTGREALELTLRRMSARDMGNRAALQVLFEPTEATADVLRERIAPILRTIVARAKAEGAVRDDFDATDVPVIVHIAGATAARMTHYGPELASRALELMIKGIAPTPDPTPIPAPLADADFGVWLQAAYRR